ncbi:tyrosine-type recombinase/integrase [Inhella gelatinilytica]|uniref:Tyrosine-type recombinase/integrase n=1 Tax=Inhella gelatinilytica TaxID=2795030 RepID=A0A931NDQ5_9BURK|nr:tyrosine-type recombinase/integrase [Inhella gelatinilytica]MBH9552874.1 tyrosine-type recombinase/integrase [Inhella gelatinilytica]
MAIRLDKVSDREKLKPRNAPYWQRLDRGCMLGFRKLTAQSTGTWMARYSDAESGERPKKSLGEFGELLPNDRYSAAKKAAEAWFEHKGRGGTSETITVKAACEAYVAHVRSEKGERQAADLSARLTRWVLSSKLAALPLSKLTEAKVKAWRAALAAAPVVVNPYAASEQQESRARAPSSVNRDMSALRALLNHALDARFVTSDAAWRVALRSIKRADGRRTLYLDREQRRRLVEAAPSDVAPLLRALALVPLRPGALGALTVASLDSRLGVLTVGHDKAGQDRRIKLPEATADFFRAQARNKLPAAPLFARADGKPWSKDGWKGPIKAAAAAAGLPPETVAYTLRHSAITDLVTGGLDLLTVAQLAGTSVAMIERHYGHLRADHAAQALERLAL